MSDPRIFFAAERTLLAWIRTGLTIMGFGFVVARFGLFLSLLATQRAVAIPARFPAHFSNAVGIALVLLGSISILLAALQHKGFVASLQSADIPPSHNRTLPMILALLLGLLGIALAAYLAL